MKTLEIDKNKKYYVMYNLTNGIKESYYNEKINGKDLIDKIINTIKSFYIINITFYQIGDIVINLCDNVKITIIIREV